MLIHAAVRLPQLALEVVAISLDSIDLGFEVLDLLLVLCFQFLDLALVFFACRCEFVPKSLDFVRILSRIELIPYDFGSGSVRLLCDSVQLLYDFGRKSDCDLLHVDPTRRTFG